MKTINFRVDEWLKNKLSSYPYPMQDSCIRTANLIKKNKIDFGYKDFPEVGRLDHNLTIDLPDQFSDIDIDQLRLALRIVFAKINHPSKPQIPPCDRQYEGLAEYVRLSQN